MSVVQMAPQASLEIENRWDDAHAAKLSPAELLLYRSNLLGGDKRVTNFGGGNTSAKVAERDPLTGETTRVLWVKGSGGDLGSASLDGFASLLGDLLVDVTRTLDPDNDRLFTWWPPWRDMRKRNIGWRIDYILASHAIAARATECKVLAEVGTSDHAPIMMTVSP